MPPLVLLFHPRVFYHAWFFRKHWEVGWPFAIKCALDRIRYIDEPKVILAREVRR